MMDVCSRKIGLIHDYVKLSSISYTCNKESPLGFRVPEKYGGNIVTSFNPDSAFVIFWKGDGAAMILNDRIKKKQVVVARGATTVANLVTGARTTKVLCPQTGAKFHEGIFESSRNMWDAISGCLDEGASIDFTGHSLGGALSVLCAMNAIQDGFSVNDVITFGQPMITDGNGVRICDSILGERLIRVVHDQDIVPRLPCVCFAPHGLEMRISDGALSVSDCHGHGHGHGAPVIEETWPRCDFLQGHHIDVYERNISQNIFLD